MTTSRHRFYVSISPTLLTALEPPVLPQCLEFCRKHSQAFNVGLLHNYEVRLVTSVFKKMGSHHPLGNLSPKKRHEDLSFVSGDESSQWHG